MSQTLTEPPSRGVRFIAVQALAKGDRAELAVEMLTELGIDEIVPWSASRSVVRWTGDRVDRALARWRATAREAAKQSRRLRMSRVADPVSTRELVALVGTVGLALVLHEDATESLATIELPGAGTVLMVIGPEGGITPDELGDLTAAGARAVSVSDGVLRTSTAGTVALAGMLLRRMTTGRTGSSELRARFRVLRRYPAPGPRRADRGDHHAARRHRDAGVRRGRHQGDGQGRAAGDHA